MNELDKLAILAEAKVKYQGAVIRHQTLEFEADEAVRAAQKAYEACEKAKMAYRLALAEAKKEML